MKFTVSRNLILGTLQKCQSIVERKSNIQILSNLLLELESSTLSISATDLEVSYKTSIPVNAESSGKVTISAKNFFEIVKALAQDELTLNKKDNNWVEIFSGKSKYNIVGLSPEDFPPLPSFSNDTFEKIFVPDLKDMISRTAFAMSTDEARYHLMGALLEKIDTNLFRMVATDGYRLSYTDKKLFEKDIDLNKKGIIIPKKGVNEIQKFCESESSDLEVSIEKNNILLRKKNEFLSVRLIDGDYPDYRSVIPSKNTKKIKTKFNDLYDSLKRVSLILDEKAKGVKMSFSSEFSEIYGSNPELGEARENFDVSFEGENLEIGFNAKYLMESLEALKGENIYLEMNDSLSPGVLKSNEVPDTICVVMPMKL